MSQIVEFAKLLDDAAREAREIAQIDPDGSLTLDDAYAI
jgi:2-oxo-3-hexenedioate decarboxylase